MKLSLPKGTKDILPNQIHLWQKAERVFAEVCAQYGFSEIRIPTFEHTDIFERGVGNATDVVRKEMYTFETKVAEALLCVRRYGRSSQKALSKTEWDQCPVRLSFFTILRRFVMRKCKRVDIGSFTNLALRLSVLRDLKLMRKLLVFFARFSSESESLKRDYVLTALVAPLVGRSIIRH